LLQRDDFAKRFAREQPIALHELLYPIMQGYDSVAMKSDVELGGTDQKFNLLVGRELQKQFGQPAQCVLTMPILEGLNGVDKMSKSLNNYVGINEPPDVQFGKLMSISDDLMWRYFELLSFESLATIADWRHEVEQGRNPRDIKVLLGKEIVARFHGTAAAARAEGEFTRRFRDGAMPEEMLEVAIHTDGRGIGIAQLLKQARLVASASEALRMVEQGGVRMDGERVSDRSMIVPADRIVVLQVGKRKFARATIR
jgi:tyrosyl-tRNA synthetase